MSSFGDMRPADLLNIFFPAFLAAITAVFHSKIEEPFLLISLYFCLIAVQILLIRVNHRNGVLSWTYDLVFPTVSILLIFDSLGKLVHSINPADIDDALIRLDYLLFSVHPTVYLEKFASPFLTDVLQLAYASYYFLPITLGVVLKLKRDAPAFDRAIFLIMLCFYLSYVGYMIWPAIGPRFTLQGLQSAELEGFAITRPIQDLLNRLEGVKRDAFPSGHTGIALTVLYLAWHFEKRLFAWFLPVVTALVISTVYLRYHYVVDVFAGVLLALFTITIGEFYYGSRRKTLDTDRRRRKENL